MKCELTNLKELKETYLSNEDELTKEDKKRLFKLWIEARKENRAKMVSLADENELIESEVKDGVSIYKGWGKLTDCCCVNVQINDGRFQLYEDFSFRIGSHRVAVYFKDVKVFDIEIEEIYSFHIYWG